jgi:hypothetical protein
VKYAGVSGTINLPETLTQWPGLHQSRVIALNQQGVPIALPSEPVTFTVMEGSIEK